MSFVRTVLGDVDTRNLGPCLAHEHIVIDESYATERHPHLLLPSVQKAVTELGELHRAGVRAVVDTMPCAAGRNVRKLAEISRLSGVSVVVPTGLHLPKYYPQGHWRYHVTAEDLSQLFIAEIEEGIDARDLSGPTLERTSHRAGLIKVASAHAPLEATAQVLFEAAAMAHLKTGAPIMTHCEDQRGPEQIAVFADLGVSARHITLSHTDRFPDLGYHRALLSTGVRVEYDRPIRGPHDGSHPTVALVAELLPAFPDQIMFGNDGARSTYWTSYGGAPGLAWLYTDFPSLLESAGVPRHLIDRAFVHNPAEAFGFAEMRS